MSFNLEGTTPATGNRGNFPFPLTKGPKESHYLTWLRNHSNYMATAGFMDYLRITGVLLRGIVINFLILLSLLLVVSAAVAYLYRQQLRSLDFEPVKVREMLATIVLKKGPVDRWLADQLPFDLAYRNALEDYGNALAKEKAVKHASKYSDDDLRYPEFFAAKLKEAAQRGQHARDSSDFVLSRLSEATGKALNDWQPSQPVSDDLKKGLIAGLNAIIQGPAIGKSAIGEPEAQWVQALISSTSGKTRATFDRLQDRGGIDIKAEHRLFNRLILEAAFPGDLGWVRTVAVTKRKLAAKSLIKSETKVMKALSALITTRWIHQREVFKNVHLRPETHNLLDTLPDREKRSAADLRRLNWLLLEDAYPELPRMSAASESEESTTNEKRIIWPRMPDPFVVTGCAVALFVLLVVISPIGGVLVRIAGARKSMERAGGDSSVKRRNRVEWVFGLAVLSLLAVAAFEALPFLENRFHQFRMNPTMDVNAIFAALSTVAVTVMGGADKVLKLLGGAKQKVAMWFIGLLGLLVPLLVILYVTEFLVYQANIAMEFFAPAVYMPFAFGLVALVAVIVGLIKKSFKPKELALLFVLAVVLPVVTVVMAVEFAPKLYSDLDMPVLNFGFVFICALELWLFCRLVVDVNLTSVHSLYRDRLASAYLMGLDSTGEVDIEEDILLEEICCHEAGSTAPYHLINAALNLQGSRDLNLRDRHSDFFIFSKRFIGGHRTGYCRTSTMEQVHPSMNLATAMAISAAAASPNMGRSTNPATVALMVMLNIRLGYWLPNPGLLEEALAGDSLQRIKDQKTNEATRIAPGFGFAEVFEQELVEIQKRWDRTYRDPGQRQQRHLQMANDQFFAAPTTGHGLVGLALSGGGIRSATINLGVAQALHEYGIFDHVDYMSTVSGGGYLGSSISTLMRTRAFSDIAGTVDVTEDKLTGEQIVQVQGAEPEVEVREYRYSRFAKLEDGIRTGGTVEAGQRLVTRFEGEFRSEIEGKVSVQPNVRGGQIVTVKGDGEPREYRFSKFDALAVETGDHVQKGQALIQRYNSLSDRFRWRVRPSALVREMLMKLDETHKWVNLSDGGHIENLAVIELLRRRCKYIIIGDGEADPELAFNGLATLIRYARIDLGIRIDLNPDQIRLNRQPQTVEETISNVRTEHWAFGTITYPPDDENGLREEEGYLLYLKSSYTGDEDEMIKEYRHSHPEFPHESTADQFFHENQFECYRALGQHIAEGAIAEMSLANQSTVLVGAFDGARKTFKAFSDELSTMSSTIAKEGRSQQQEADQKKMDRWKQAIAPANDEVPPPEEEKQIKKQ